MLMNVCRNDMMTDNLSRLSMDVGYCAYAEVDQEWRAEGVCAPCNKIYILEEGEGILEAGGETVVMKPGMVYLLPAGLTVDFRCPAFMRKYFFHLNLHKPDRYDLFLDMKRIGVLPFD